jgi:hypothetical protein
MSVSEDKSYERYKQYRLNKYRYEQEQIVFPLTIVIALATIISFWKYILIAVAIVALIAVIAILIYWHLKRQVIASQPISLTAEDARDGVTAHINVKYKLSQAKLELEIPPDVKDGQKFVVKNVLFKDTSGKAIKKRVRFQVQICAGGKMYD